jgi:hypothetical protein
MLVNIQSGSPSLVFKSELRTSCSSNLFLKKLLIKQSISFKFYILTDFDRGRVDTCLVGI